MNFFIQKQTRSFIHYSWFIFYLFVHSMFVHFSFIRFGFLSPHMFSIFIKELDINKNKRSRCTIHVHCAYMHAWSRSIVRGVVHVPTRVSSAHLEDPQSASEPKHSVRRVSELSCTVKRFHAQQCETDKSVSVWNFLPLVWSWLWSASQNENLYHTFKNIC